MAAEPRQKRTLQDYWNIPFRGLVPGGLNDQKDNPALPKITNPPDATVMEESDTSDKLLIAEEITCVRRYFHAFQVQVGAVETVQVLGQDTYRHRALIRNVGPGSVFLGATESVGSTGFSLFQSTNQGVLELATTEELWALQEPAQSSNAVLHILIEFDKYDTQVKGKYF